MILEYTRYKIDETRRDGFVADYQKAIESLKASKHCLSYELTQCKEDFGLFILRLEWDSEEGHLQGFRKSAEFRSFFAHVGPYVKDIEEMRHYEVILVGEKSRSASSHS